MVQLLLEAGADKEAEGKVGVAETERVHVTEP